MVTPVLDVTELRHGNLLAFDLQVRHLAGDDLQRTGGPRELEQESLMRVAWPAANSPAPRSVQAGARKANSSQFNS